MFKCGFVTIVGNPNVGKSTLLNAVIGQKISIVSPKAQTTRNIVKGILTTDNYQMIFLDTPGIQKIKTSLDEFMIKSATTAVIDVDVIVVLLDGSKKITEEDLKIVESYKGRTHNLVLAVNKIDATTFERLYPELNKLNLLNYVKDIVCISALKKENIDELLKVLEKLLPEGEKMYPDDMVTEHSERFLVGEILREKALLMLDQEIPHGIAIEIEKFTEEEKIIKIDALIICERDSHKGIIIGKDGEMLKKIAISARRDIEKLVDKQVFLKIFVKVRSDWRNNTEELNEIGYNKKDL
ncbi:MAG: GTPase Era [Clostridia bacterium]|jgi:GTP-binding protein Era|nr:GTPase Era [Clostridia bacterium]